MKTSFKPALRILFVDLDETLVCARFSAAGDAPQAKVPDRYGDFDVYGVFVRPGAVEALVAARDTFDEVSVYTAADRAYADAVVEAAGLRDYVDEVYTLDDVFEGKQALPNLRGVPWALIDNDEEIAMNKVSSIVRSAGVPLREAMERHWVFIPDFAPKNLRDVDNYEPIDLMAAVDTAAWRTR